MLDKTVWGVEMWERRWVSGRKKGGGSCPDGRGKRITTEEEEDELNLPPAF